VTYCILDRIKFNVEEVLQLEGPLPSFSEVGCVLAGLERAAFCLGQVGSRGEDLLNLANAEASRLLLFAATRHYREVFFIVRDILF